MKKWALLGLGLVIVAAVAGILAMRKPAQDNQPRSTNMKLSSTAFIADGAIPNRYSCQGDGVSPALTIGEVPTEAQSLALVVDDPDAPSGTYDHWVMWNIPVSVTEIPENWTPEAGVSVGANGAGNSVWTPPCPPSGTHHYHFKLYALDRKLDLTAGSSKSELEAAMKGHIVGETELIGTYTKS
jgi:Raf kinase inhibitor-like YbhB/YbcL family protein